MVKATTGNIATLIGNGSALRAIKPTEFVDDTFGLPTVTDIIRELEKPGRDPRPAFQTAAFTEGVEKIGDLVPGMVLEGQVTNVAAFGAFVDVGVHQDGLVHVSALSRTYVKDPREVVKPGDIVRVKVLDIDVPRKRISLTLRLDDDAASIAAPKRGSAPASRPDRPDRAGAAGAAGRPERPERPDEGRRGGGDARGNAGRGRDTRRGRDDAPLANTALADALRRAGLDGGSEPEQRRR